MENIKETFSSESEGQSIVGLKANIDSDVRVGYPTKRDIKIKKTEIGDFAEIRSSTVIYTNTKIGHHFQTGHSVIIREENIIDNNVQVWSNSCIDYGCKIGDNVKIHNNVYICQYTEIENDVFIGPGVITANDLCPVCTLCMKGPVIKRGAKIGANVTLLPHVVIGEYSLIGAGSVVTKDISPYSLVYGNPAKIVGSVKDLRCKFNKKTMAYPEL